MVGRQIVSSKVWERKSKYFCRELVVYPEKSKYRTSRQYYKIELKRLSEDELVEELSESIRKSDMGATKPARAVSKSMREKTIQHFDL